MKTQSRKKSSDIAQPNTHYGFKYAKHIQLPKVVLLSYKTPFSTKTNPHVNQFHLKPIQPHFPQLFLRL